MTSKKEFDCVAAKRDAQETIYADIKSMTAEQEIEYFRNAVSEGPLGDWWKAVGKKQATTA